MPGHRPKPDPDDGEGCDSCGWITDDLEEFDAYARTTGHGPFTPDDQKEWAWLCRVCRSTYAGNAHLYPRNYPDQPTLKTIAWGINYVAEVVRKTLASPS